MMNKGGKFPPQHRFVHKLILHYHPRGFVCPTRGLFYFLLRRERNSERLVSPRVSPEGQNFFPQSAGSAFLLHIPMLVTTS